MLNVVKQLCSEVQLPKMLQVKQKFDPQCIVAGDLPGAIAAEMAKASVAGAVKAGQQVAITCGSRGLANHALITKAIVDVVKARGAKPVVIPAMGSHGGATAEGQKELLARFGVTEEYIGCPILSSMETIEIGTSEGGHRVRLDKIAAQSDAIIVAHRIKPHTDFRGPYESGLMKMLAIGLGKREGAAVTHEAGFSKMAKMIEQFGLTILKNAPVVMGLGIIENAYHQTCRIEALSPQEIIDKEPALLDYAKSRMAKILIDPCDILVVDQIGKEISGDGMDPNVSGATSCAPYVTGGLNAQRTVVLSLTADTHGQAVGMGAAHAITKRLFNEIDYDATYVNALTARVIDYTRIPPIMDNDKEAIQFAARSAASVDLDNLRIIRIQDTMNVEKIWISEALRQEAEQHNDIEILSEAVHFPFNSDGNLW
ncbi:MAG: nickel-dependent lactate racemase [Spirochaetes bacterium]|nr:nickel-dependent lactate racemase [Spirochaetota bacterium]